MKKRWKLTTAAAAAMICACLITAGGCGGGGGGGSSPGLGFSTTAGLLWSPAKLDAQMKANPDIVVLDVRKDASRADGSVYTPYDDEHIDGSHYLDFFTFGDPYPDDQGLIDATLIALGITVDSTIVLYDAGIANPQGKVFFNLERQGCTDVHILDGGFPVWDDAGYPTDTVKTPDPTPSNWVANIDNTCYAELPAMKAMWDVVDSGVPHNFTLTDYREEPLFLGHKICPDAARHGRIRHTNHLDWHDYFDSVTGKWLTPALITSKSVAAGLDKGKLNVLI